MAARNKQTSALPSIKLNMENIIQGETPGVHYDAVSLCWPTLGIEQRFNVGRLARRQQSQGQSQGQGQQGQFNAAMQATYAPDDLASVLKTMSQDIKGLKQSQSALASNIKKMGGSIPVSTGRGQQAQRGQTHANRTNAAPSYSKNAQGSALFEKVPA